jgi:hypothetical protein
MLQDINLNSNPFMDLTPDLQPNQEIVWGGMSDVKNKIEKVYTDTFRYTQRQVVLNWGPWGGGKTHAAVYFSSRKFENANLTQAYIQSPKKGASATDDFFVNILDGITFDKIINQVKELIEDNGEDIFIKNLGNKMGSQEFAKAIALLATDDEDTLEMMRRYFYVGATKAELKKLKLPRDIASDSDTIKILAGIIYCFIGDDDYNGRFCLWIDEMEDLIYYSSAHYRAFSQILRELIDRLNERFTIFLNFTLAESEEKTIELLLGAALWSRISRKIRFKELSLGDAQEYISDLLGVAKIKKTSKAPIDQVQIDYLLSFIPQSNLTPREINRYMSGVLSLAIEEEKQSVDKAIIDEYIRDKNDDE